MNRIHVNDRHSKSAGEWTRSLNRGISRLHIHTILMGLLAVAIPTGCRDGSTGSVTPPAAPKVTVLPAQLPSRLSTPPVVLRLADEYIASLTNQTKASGFVRDDFCRSFFDGFTMPGASTSGGTEAGRRGFLAGQEYYRANPAKIKETMEGFGYAAVEFAGVWTVSFEHSGFCPDTQQKQTWWLMGFGKMQSDLPKDAPIPTSGVHIRVRGYLSPPGGFGHLNQYGREILATSISKIGG